MAYVHGHPTVLLVDDHDDVREGLSELLRLEGYTVVTAQNGRDALNQLYQGARPCIILMDLMMPVMAGFEFRQEQREHPEFRDIPIIVYSAIHDLKRVAGHLDAHAYVEKPIMLQNLLALLREHCLK